jgi:hypothetical protein
LIVSTGGFTGAATALGGVGRGFTGLGTGFGVGLGTGFGTGLGALVGTGGVTGGVLFATGGGVFTLAALGTTGVEASGVAAPVITGTDVPGVVALMLVSGGVAATSVTLMETSCTRRSLLLKRLPGMPSPGKSNFRLRMSACNTSEITSACFSSRRKRQRRQSRRRVRFLERAGLSDLTVDDV